MGLGSENSAIDNELPSEEGPGYQAPIRQLLCCGSSRVEVARELRHAEPLPDSLRNRQGRYRLQDRRFAGKEMAEAVTRQRHYAILRMLAE